jgi:hypothetical protein
MWKTEGISETWLGPLSVSGQTYQDAWACPERIKDPPASFGLGFVYSLYFGTYLVTGCSSHSICIHLPLLFYGQRYSELLFFSCWGLGNPGVLRCFITISSARVRKTNFTGLRHCALTCKIYVSHRERKIAFLGSFLCSSFPFYALSSSPFNTHIFCAII